MCNTRIFTLKNIMIFRQTTKRWMERLPESLSQSCLGASRQTFEVMCLGQMSNMRSKAEQPLRPFPRDCMASYTRFIVRPEIHVQWRPQGRDNHHYSITSLFAWLTLSSFPGSCGGWTESPWIFLSRSVIILLHPGSVSSPAGVPS